MTMQHMQLGDVCSGGQRIFVDTETATGIRQSAIALDEPACRLNTYSGFGA